MFIQNSNKVQSFDQVIIGAGLFGLYAALLLMKKGAKVCVVEKGSKPFSRASMINQARVHHGYHYPRSIETASKAAQHYDRFRSDFKFAINDSFKQIYAIAKNNSKTSVEGFVKFCDLIEIPLQQINANSYFKKGTVEAAFSTSECSFNYVKIRDYFLEELRTGITFFYDSDVKFVSNGVDEYEVETTGGVRLETPIVINATYSSINSIIKLFKQKVFDLKYELCEVALCKVSEEFRNLGITVMDGDFFSMMPFGDSALHSLTTVGHTPRATSYDLEPAFFTDKEHRVCKMHNTKKCYICNSYLKSGWVDMDRAAKTFLSDKFDAKYRYSLFEIKPLLKSSEEDDSRPTLVREHTKKPRFISVLAGKISDIYELDRMLEDA